MKKLRDKKYLTLILMILLVIGIVVINKISNIDINKGIVKVDKVYINQINTLSANVNELEEVVSKGYDEINYEIKYTLQKKENIDARDVVIKATLSDEESKYAQFKKIEDENITSIISEDKREIQIQIKNVKLGKENTLILKLLVTGAPNEFKINPKIEIKEITQKEYINIDNKIVNVNTNSLSGIVKDEQKMKVSNIELVLLKDKEEIKRTYTDENGYYVFSDIDQGEYTLKLAEEKYQMGETKIQVKESTTLDLNITKVQPYQIKTEKSIVKLKLKINGKEEEYTYNKLQTVLKSVKNAKQIEGEITYEVKVKNIGEKQGVVTVLKDEVPEGLTFNEEKNPNWIQKDGKLYNFAIEGITLGQGEEKTSKLILDITNTNEAKTYINMITSIGEVYDKVVYILDRQVYKEEEVLEGEKVENLSIENKNFKGWYTDKNYTNKYNFNNEVTKDIILYGYIEENKEYTVRYVDGQDIVKEEKLKEGSNLNPPTVSKKGYTFKYWSLNQNGEEYDLTTKVTQDITLYAVYEINKYTVEFINDGKTYNKQTIEYNGNIKPVEDPNKTGYTFKYWSLSTDGNKYDLTTKVTKNIKLYAVYEINKYTVEFINDGKTYNKQTVEYKGKIKNVENPSKEGYTFKHWSLSIDAEAYDISLPVTDNIKLYAVYEINKYTVEFINDGKTYNKQTIEYNGQIKQIENPIKEHYTFKYWSLKQDGQAYDLTTKVTKDIKLYAVYEINKYTITFIDNGNEVLKKEVEAGTIVSAPIVSKEGYTFKHWSLNQNGEAYNTLLPVMSDITLYSVYEINKYTIEFYDNDKKIKEIQVEYNNTINTKDVPVVSKKGYTFIGWYEKNSDETFKFTTKITSNKKLYSKYEIIKNSVVFNDENRITTQKVEYGQQAVEIPSKGKEGYTFKHWSLKQNGEPFDFNTQIVETITLYAVYEINKYTVEFINEGQTYNKQTIEYNGQIASVENPSKEGYTFKYWSLTENGNIYNLQTRVTENIKLYAVYEINKYTVEFNDENRITTKQVEYKNTVEAVASQGKEGYTFKHWSLNVGGESFDFNTPITDSITLYAVYEINKYTVEFINEGQPYDKQTIEYNGQIASVENPSKEGYTFKHWSLTENGEKYDLTTKVTQNIKLYAVYEINEYTVEFINEGQTYNKQTIEYNGQISPVENPSKEGYTFKYWSLSVDGLEYDLNTKVTNNIKLYAVYQINEYTVKFMNDGNLFKQVQVQHGSLVERPSENPSKDYNIFVGWTLNGDIYDFNIPVTDNITLYSKYELVEKPTITHMPTEWTKDKVTVTIKNEQHPEYKYKYQIDDNDYQEYTEGGFTVDENCKITAVSVKEEVTSEKEEHNITNIDKIKPIITSLTADEKTPSGFTIHTKAKDNESGLAKINVFVNDNAETSYTYEINLNDEKEESHKVTGLDEKTTYKVKVQAIDKVGNESEVSEIDVTTEERIIVARIIGRDNSLYDSEDEYELFESLQEAIDACNERQCTIQMVLDTTESAEVLEGQDITLDLNGKTITGQRDYTLQNQGSLTIVDNAEEPGSIVNTTDTAIKNVSNGTLQIGENEEPISVSIEKPNIVGKEVGIYTQEDSTLKFFDGRIEGKIAIQGIVDETPYLYNAKVDTTDKQVATLTILAEAEARVNSVYYTKLSEAVEESEEGNYQTETHDIMQSVIPTSLYPFNYNEEEKTLTSTNQNINDTISSSYIKLDLTNYTENQELIVSASISSERNDYGYVTITKTKDVPEYNNQNGRLIYISGDQEVTQKTILEKGNIYYIHLGYRKDGNNSSEIDTFTINSITINDYVVDLFNIDLSSDIVTPGDYGFTYNLGKLVSNNTFKDRTTAHSYIAIDLSEYQEDQTITINAEISSENSDRGYITITNNTDMPQINSVDGRVLSISGQNVNAQDYEATLKAGITNYIHFVYVKDNSSSYGSDTFTINSIYKNIIRGNLSETLNSDIPKLNEKIDTIEMLRNITLTTPIEIQENKEAVLDLRGYTLTTSSDDYVLKNNGKLTIVDSMYNKEIEDNQNDYEQQQSIYDAEYEEALSRYNQNKKEIQEQYDNEYKEQLKEAIEENYTLNDYIKENLVLQLDGIEHGEEEGKWKDLSGNNHDGTISEAIWTEDNGLSFDGNNDYVSIGELNNSNITLETVFSNKQSKFGEIEIGCNYETGGYGLSLENGKVGGEISINGAYYELYSNISIDLNKKYHVVLTYDGNIMKLYVNGVLQGSKEITGTITNPSSSTSFMLGTNPSGNQAKEKYLNGIIYSFRMYDKALTEEEINKNYKVDQARYSVENEELTSNTSYGEVKSDSGVDPYKVFDKNKSTTFENTISGESTIEWDLPKEKTLTSFKIYGSSNISKYPKTVQLDASKDGQTYETIVEKTTLQPKSQDDYNEIKIKDYDSYKYFKWIFTNEGSTISINEIELEIYNVARNLYTDNIKEEKIEAESTTVTSGNITTDSSFSGGKGVDYAYDLSFDYNVTDDFNCNVYLNIYATYLNRKFELYLDNQKLEYTNTITTWNYNNLKIDLGGLPQGNHTIAFKKSSDAYVPIYDYFVIQRESVPQLKQATLKQAIQKGTIISTTNSVIYNNINANLIVEDAILTLNKAGSSNNYYNLVTNDGKITLNKNAQLNLLTNYNNGIYNGYTGDIESNGSTINLDYSNENAIYNTSLYETGFNNINIITSKGSSYALYDTSSSNLVLDGFNVNGNINAYNNTGDLTINNSTINANINSKDNVEINTSSIKSSGIIYNYGNLNVNESTMLGTSSIQNYEVLKFNDSNLNISSSGDSIRNLGTLTLEKVNGTFSSGNYDAGISNENNSNLIITDSNLDGSSQYRTLVEITKTSKANINGNTTINIPSGIAIYNLGTLNIGANDGTVSDLYPIIDSSHAILNKNIFNMYDGKIIGEIDYSVTGAINNIEDGYELNIENNENKEELTLISPTKNVARINDNNYTTLNDAVNHVNEGETIELLSDQALNRNIIINQDSNFKIDLNGYTIRSFDSDYLFQNNGNITIYDDNDPQKIGTLKTAYGKLINNNGDLNINNINIKGYGNFPVLGVNNTHFNENVINNNSSLNMNNINIDISSDNSDVTYNNEDATLNINSSYISVYGKLINKGTTTIDKTKSDRGSIINNSKLIINESNLVSSGSAGCSVSNTATLTSTSNKLSTITNEVDATLTSTGDTISSLNNKGQSDIFDMIKGETITNSSNGITNVNSGIISIIDNKDLGIVNIQNGEIGRITNMSSKEINIYEGKITDYIANDSIGTINLYNGIIETTDASYALANRSTGIVNIGTKDNKASKTSPSITATRSSSAVYNNPNGTLNFYDGIIKGVVAIDGKVSEIEENYDIIREEEDGLEVKYLDRLPVAKIKSTGDEYYTLQDAINNVNKSEETIQLLREITTQENTEVTTISDDKNIILDLNGFKILQNNDKLLINNGTLKLIDSKEPIEDDSNYTYYEGSITTNKGEILENNGTFIYQSGNLESTVVISDIIKNNNVMQMDGGYISTVDTSDHLIDNYGQLTINNGLIKSSRVYDLVLNEENATATINDGIFKLASGDGTNTFKISYVFTNNGIMYIYGGTYVEYNSNQYHYAKPSIVLNNSTGNVTINGLNLDNGIGTSVKNYGQADISSSKLCGEVLNYNNATINLTDVTSESEVKNEDNGTININSGTYNSAVYNNGAGILNIKKGTYNNGVYNRGTGITNIGVQGDEISDGVLNVSQTDPSIVSENTALTITNGTVNFYDGQIIGITAYTGVINEIEDGYEIITGTTEDGKERKYLDRKLTAKIKSTDADYYTIQDAINNVTQPEETIQILRDITTMPTTNTITVPYGKNIKLDLNGHKISQNNQNFLVNNGTLMVEDDSLSKTGEITSINELLFENNGSLTLEGIKITSNVGLENIIKNNSIMNINESNITTINSVRLSTKELKIIENTELGTLNITNTDINSTSINGGVRTISVVNNLGNLNVIGGKITLNQYRDDIMFVNNFGQLSITGSDYNSASNEWYRIPKFVNNNSNNDINIDSITTTNISLTSTVISNSATGGTVTLSNSTIAGQIINNSTGTFKLDTVTTSSSIENSNGQMNLDNVTSTSSISNGYRGVLNINSGSYNFVSNDDGTININGGTFSGKVTNGYNGKLNIYNATINNSVENASNGTINILGGTITSSSGNALISSSTGTINIGEKGAPVLTDKPIIIGKNYGLYSSNNSAIINFYDGVISGETGAISGVVDEVEPGYKIVTNPNDNLISATLTLIGEDERVAVVNNINFKSLQDAVNACIDGVETNIIIYANITLTEDIIVPESKIVKIYLNGYQIIYGDYKITGGKVEIVDESNPTGVLASIAKFITDKLNISDIRKNIVIYEMEDGSKLESNKTYKLYKKTNEDYMLLKINRQEEVGRYEIGNKEDEMTTVRGRLYINNLSEGDYKIVDNNGKEITFSITNNEQVIGRVRDNTNVTTTKVIATAIAQLIITIQTGVIRGSYIILMVLILGILSLLFMILRQKKVE